jgi:predicted nuclease with TOPRIM domain
MKEQLIGRLEKLKSEFESGRKMLAELDAKRQSLEQTLLRISGAIQVLEEECASAQASCIETSAVHDGPLPKAVASR